MRKMTPHKCRIKLGKFHFDISCCFGVIKKSRPGGGGIRSPGEIGLIDVLWGANMFTGMSSQILGEKFGIYRNNI